MNDIACIHRTTDNYCYALDENNLVINIKTGYDVEQVFLHYGDPYEYGILGGKHVWRGEREEIVYKKRLHNQLWWTTTIAPKYKRAKYYFELRTKEETWFYLENGMLTKEQMELPGKPLQNFVFPWMNPSDLNQTPEWVNQTIWYQIFPERFCNGDTSNDPLGTKPWAKGKVANEESYGGDLAGITSKLSYLSELGINGIYLTPIVEATTSHKYDTTNYTKIDPHFGTNETFKELVVAAHSKGIRVMLDGVFNHSGSSFAPWLDVLEKGPESKYYSWFFINQWPFDQTRKDTRTGDFYSFAFTSLMPKLNTNNDEVIAYLLDVCEFWVREYDIDGFRLDVANEMSHKFNKAFRRRMHQLKPDLYILGEIWHDAIHWLRGDEYDSVMNYPLTSSIQDFWIDASLTKEEFEFAINRCYTQYMQQNNDVLFNLLDSHDTPRLINVAGNLDVFYQQLAILFTMPGSPCIYYGTEIALEGEHDPDCRRCMPWDEIEAGHYEDRISILKALIALRKTTKAFTSRNFHFPNHISNPRVIEYIKIDEQGETITVVLNCSDEDVVIPCEKWQCLFERHYQNNVLQPNGILMMKDNLQ